MNAGNRKIMEIFNNRAAVFGLFTILVLAFIALTADFIAPYDPNTVDLSSSLFSPSSAHPMGTDQLGRDLLSRIMYGTRITFEISLVTALITAAIGITIGILAGYYGGLVDEVLMRVADMLLAFPSLLFALIIVGGMGAGVINTIIAITITGWLTYARVARASALSIKEKSFVEGARAIGFSDMYICAKYVLPNCLSPIIALFTLNIGSIILMVASLGFLGLGAQPPIPEWGTMLSEGQGLIRDCPWMVVFPGLMIMITVVAFNFIGDGLRDVYDPHQTMIK